VVVVAVDDDIDGSYGGDDGAGGCGSIEGTLEMMRVMWGWCGGGSG